MNRCTDRTEAIALAAGARVVQEDARNLSKIRNKGLAAATGDIVVTVDADSRLHPMTFHDAHLKLSQDDCIGGGCLLLPERWSVGIILTGLALLPYLARYRVSVGCFWTLRETSEAIGGFNPDFITVEDVDYALRLKAYGKERGKKFGCLYRAALVTSCRKFDQHGEWHLLKNPSFLRKVFQGNNQEIGDSYWYKPGR